MLFASHARIFVVSSTNIVVTLNNFITHGFYISLSLRSFRCSIFKVRSWVTAFRGPWWAQDFESLSADSLIRLRRLSPSPVPSPLSFATVGGHKWIRTTDLTLIRRAL